MEDYLIDRETLGQFIDELMKRRTLPVNTAEELASYRETQIRALDNQLTEALLGNLSEEQATNLNQLLDQYPDNPDVFMNFFAEQNIDVEQTLAGAIQSFSNQFLGGAQNA